MWFVSIVLGYGTHDARGNTVQICAALMGVKYMTYDCDICDVPVLLALHRLFPLTAHSFEASNKGGRP